MYAQQEAIADEYDSDPDDADMSEDSFNMSEDGGDNDIIDTGSDITVADPTQVLAENDGPGTHVVHPAEVIHNIPNNVAGDINVTGIPRHRIRARILESPRINFFVFAFYK